MRSCEKSLYPASRIGGLRSGAQSHCPQFTGALPQKRTPQLSPWIVGSWLVLWVGFELEDRKIWLNSWRVHKFVLHRVRFGRVLLRPKSGAAGMW